MERRRVVLADSKTLGDERRVLAEVDGRALCLRWRRTVTELSADGSGDRYVCAETRGL